MKLELQKFGKVLTSRSSGKEAYLAAKAYSLPTDTEDSIEVDFEGVQVLAPSWADEFITPLLRDFSKRVVFLPSNNSSVRATLDFLRTILTN